MIGQLQLKKKITVVHNDRTTLLIYDITNKKDPCKLLYFANLIPGGGCPLGPLLDDLAHGYMSTVSMCSVPHKATCVYVQIWSFFYLPLLT